MFSGFKSEKRNTRYAKNYRVTTEKSAFLIPSSILSFSSNTPSALCGFSRCSCVKAENSQRTQRITARGAFPSGASGGTRQARARPPGPAQDAQARHELNGFCRIRKACRGGRDVQWRHRYSQTYREFGSGVVAAMWRRVPGRSYRA